MNNLLDKATLALRSIGVSLGTTDQAPVVALLDKVSAYDTARVTSIAHTLQQSSGFNAAVREQLAGMDISSRYLDISESFNSVREDAQRLTTWMDDGKLDFTQKLKLKWMNFRRGTIPQRFAQIQKLYLGVCQAARDQLHREGTILEAYKLYHLATKHSEVDAQEVLKTAAGALEQRKRGLAEASARLDAAAASGVSGPDLARLELARDEASHALQDEDKRYQLIKNIADDIRVGYNAAELVFARIQQDHDLKERVYHRMVTFFANNETVLTGLSAAFITSQGLHEATNVLTSTAEGTSRGLEALASNGQKVLKDATRAAYGPTLRVEAVKSLAEAIITFQEEMMQDIAACRAESSQAAQDIQNVTEDSKRRFAALIAKVD